MAEAVNETPEGALFHLLMADLEQQLDPRFDARLRGIGRAVEEGDWSAVRGEAVALGEAMVAKAHRDPVPYGVLAVYRALAASETGAGSEAEWYWTVALNLLPGLDRVDLSRAYEMAPELRTVRLPAPHPGPDCPQSDTRFRFSGKPRVHRALLGPADRSRRDVQGFYAEAVVGTDGLLHRPLLTAPPKSMGGDIAYAGLEAMREFRFVPARRKGKPVECPWGITVSFHSHRR